MPSPRDAIKPQPHPYPHPLSVDMEASMTLPRRVHPSLSKLFESTTSLSTSQPGSGTATPTVASPAAPATPAGSVRSPGTRLGGAATPNSLPAGVSDAHRTLIQQAFVPSVAVLADAETEALLHGKGLAGGLLQLLRPFGEHVTGKVTVRDSNGASRSWDDFGVRFRAVEEAGPGGDVAQVEALVDRHLQHAEFHGHDTIDAADVADAPTTASSSSPFHALYLRRLLSALPVAPHETFAHPVAGIVAVSARNPHPIEALRRLYTRQHDGDLRFPPWVDNDFLRYYVLVHDEETGDIAKSSQTFDSMKRHFGLHCHLLRLKTQQCIASDDDSAPLPPCAWLSAAEELAEIQRRETTDDMSDMTDPTPYLPDSDISSLRTFVRELVTQSIIPNMERSVATWNEQILSRRRGLSGRFMSLSKRWTPFGSARSTSNASPASPNSNYDSLHGFYRPDAPEAIMRRLADYCFMLRDWKLALSTYDILRTDFQNDKAWRHYAGAAEMAAMSALMAPTPLSSKARAENIDSWIEAASYSYTDRQRSPSPYYALRTLALCSELLRLRGSTAADDAARWATRILETGLVGAIGHALVTERISACYAVRTGIGTGTCKLGSRRRKAALWALLAAQNWLQLGKSTQAEKALDTALTLYNVQWETRQGAVGKLPLSDMQRVVDDLRQQIMALRLQNRGYTSHDDDDDDDDDDDNHDNNDGAGAGAGAGAHNGNEHGQPHRGTRAQVDDEATEKLDASTRPHRMSLSGGALPLSSPPPSPLMERRREDGGVDPRSEGFE